MCGGEGGSLRVCGFACAYLSYPFCRSVAVVMTLSVIIIV